ncbi:hypothetical protein LTR66_010879 [Elasticomyces elasticus]|nr:hypothetical protein LTR66_010879 [Elasticomyces elasticus]KAK4988827.1 hypothetical protein LTR50_003672 [Elasticomyces elasticus]
MTPIPLTTLATPATQKRNSRYSQSNGESLGCPLQRFESQATTCVSVRKKPRSSPSIERHPYPQRTPSVTSAPPATPSLPRPTLIRLRADKPDYLGVEILSQCLRADVETLTVGRYRKGRCTEELTAELDAWTRFGDRMQLMVEVLKERLKGEIREREEERERKELYGTSSRDP